MKVRVSYTVEVNEDERLAMGTGGKPATHLAIAEHFQRYGEVEGRTKVAEAVRQRYAKLAQVYADKAKQGVKEPDTE